MRSRIRNALLGIAMVAPVACRAAPPVLARLQAEVVRDGLLFVPGSVAGHEAMMLLDTGAGATLVSTRFAERIGLRLDRGTSGTAIGVAGKAAMTMVEGVEIRVGDLRMTTSVAVVPLDFNAGLGRELDVVLGRDFFRACVVEMDFGTCTVVCHDRGSFRYRGPGVTLPLQVGEHGMWHVAGEIEELGVASFALDTGDNGTLTLHAPFVREHRFLEGRELGMGLRGGVGGDFEVVTTAVRRFTLGTARFEDVPVETDEVAAGTFVRTDAAGNLGTGVLQRCRLFVDGSRNELHLEPIAERVAAPFARNRCGLALAHRGTHLEVLQVARGSPAAAAGMAVGDRIRAIDGASVDGTYWQSAWRWVQQAEGTKVSLELVDGTRRTFVFGRVP